MLSPVRPSVTLSVTWIDQSKSVEDRISLRNFHSTVAPSLFLWDKFEISSINSSGGVKQRWGLGNKLFSSFRACVDSRKRLEIRQKLLLGGGG